MKIFYNFLVVLFFTQSASALVVEERITDPQLEQRATTLFTEIKCLVCEAQSIESSNAEFAASLRKTIREKILENKSDAEIKSELRKEFGDQIFMTVEMKSKVGFWAWALPFIFAGLAGLIIFRRSQK